MKSDKRKIGFLSIFTVLLNKEFPKYGKEKNLISNNICY